MFSANLRESGQSKIPFHEIESRVLGAILNFIYTSEIVVFGIVYCSLLQQKYFT